MFLALKNKLHDAGTLSALCRAAEEVARSQGSDAPGSEHYVLASFTLADGTAERALASLGATPEAFRNAIHQQFLDALAHAGMDTSANSQEEHVVPVQVRTLPKLYQAAPSGQNLVQRLAATAAVRGSRELLAADVLLAVAQEEHSIAARALKLLGISPKQLIQAAEQEVKAALA